VHVPLGEPNPRERTVGDVLDLFVDSNNRKRRRGDAA
jgi:hypothetical protein